MARSKRKSHGGARRGAGAPRTLPAGTRNRTIRLTDDEFARVKAFVAAMRAKSPEKQAS